MSVSWDELKRSIKEVIREEQAKTPPPATTETHAAHVIGCKDCFNETMGKLGKEAEYACWDCGLPIPKSALDMKTDDQNSVPCPICGGKYLRKRRKDQW